MTLQEVTDRSAWEEFVAGQPHATFLQSWHWGDFQEALHRKVRRLARVKDGRLLAAALMVVTRRKVASYAYVPYGPVLDWTDRSLAVDVLRELRAEAKSDGAHYLRLDPHVPSSAEVESILREAGFRRAVNYVQAESVWVLDLEAKQEVDLLKAMRTTTRQLIRNADKLGVTIESTTDPARLPEFGELLRLTGSRQSFIPQEFDYLRLQFEMLAKAGLSTLSGFIRRRDACRSHRHHLRRQRGLCARGVKADQAAYQHSAAVGCDQRCARRRQKAVRLLGSLPGRPRERPPPRRFFLQKGLRRPPGPVRRRLGLPIRPAALFSSTRNRDVPQADATPVEINVSCPLEGRD